MNNFIANTESLTLHIRLTKKCNADCSYCSSFETKASERMSISNLSKSLDFISKLIIDKNLGGERKMLTVQYVGGEITTLPKDYLSEFCGMVEQKLSPLFKNFKHGAQSNLIASQDRIDHLVNLFESNIGTSLDNFTEQRTIKGSSSKYKTIFMKNVSYTKKLLGKNLSSIIVIDEKMKPHIYDEIKLAENQKTHITLRPVFSGGMPIETVEDQSLKDIYNNVFDDWFMKSNISIEPHFSLLQKRFIKHQEKYTELPSISGCPFQNNCATSSLNLEPNGDLFVCLDMADSKHYPFGNAIKEEINEEIFSLLLSRTDKLNTDCKTCDYYNECQGGCMNEAIEHTGDVFGKTNYCFIWKNIFKRIDDGIEKHGIDNVGQWINKLT